jgi:hypothetical protein
MSSRQFHLPLYSYLAYIVGQGSRDRMHSQAMNMLHEVNYNYIKAKFFVVFPYYLHYNRYKSSSQINISDAEMDNKINEHLENLRSCKTKDMQKWIFQLEALLETKVNIAKVNQLIDQGKQNKFEVPEHIKDQIEKAIKLGKDLKKILTTKMSLEKLLQRK